MTNRITNFWNNRLSIKQRQWAWFVMLWCGGFLTVTLIGSIIKLIIGIKG